MKCVVMDTKFRKNMNKLNHKISVFLALASLIIIYIYIFDVAIFVGIIPPMPARRLCA